MNAATGGSKTAIRISTKVMVHPSNFLLQTPAIPEMGWSWCSAFLQQFGAIDPHAAAGRPLRRLPHSSVERRHHRDDGLHRLSNLREFMEDDGLEFVYRRLIASTSLSAPAGGGTENYRKPRDAFKDLASSIEG
jgi:hypothetical protein